MPQQTPEWLPDTVSVSGDWNTVLDRLYRIFEHDFKRTGCSLEDRSVWWDRHIRKGEQYEEGFWHLITRFDHHVGDRLLDPRRAERLPWCKPTIEHCREPVIRVWDYDQGRKVRTYVWLENWDYVVVLEKRTLRGGKEIAFLITAYHVDGTSSKEKLLRQYRDRVQPT